MNKNKPIMDDPEPGAWQCASCGENLECTFLCRKCGCAFDVENPEDWDFDGRTASLKVLGEAVECEECGGRAFHPLPLETTCVHCDGLMFG